jgi:hypothetical protein
MTNSVTFPAAQGGNAGTYTDAVDATTATTGGGLAGGGWRYRYIVTLSQAVIMAQSATASAVAAAASAATATSAPGTVDTSASSNTIASSGSKTFTVSAGKLWTAGQYVVIADTAAPTTNSMFGQISSYSGTTLVLTILSSTGSGTKTAWTLTLSGPQGSSSFPNVAAGGTVDAITATFAPAVASLLDTLILAVVSAGVNATTTPTFAPNGLAAHTITARGGLALKAGDTGPSGYVMLLEYNLGGTRWELLNPALGASPRSIAAAGGTVDAITATFAPAVALADQTIVYVVSAGANTSTTPTFAPNGLTAHTITTRGGLALRAGEIGPAGFVSIFEYNLANTRWELLNPVPPSAPAAVSTTAPTSPGQYATLVDARTLPVGAVQSVNNTSPFYRGIKDNASTQLGWVRPYESASVELLDNTTLAGIWAVSNVAKIAETAQMSTSATDGPGVGGYQVVKVQIDANRTAFLAMDDTSALYCTVYDASAAVGAQWGAPTLVRSGFASGAHYGAILTATAGQILVMSVTGTTVGSAVTLTIGGATTTTVTVNTPVPWTASATITAITMPMIAANGTSYCLGYQATGNAYFKSVTVAGTVPTVGADTAAIANGDSVIPQMYVAGSVLRTITASGATPFTVAGSGLALGTASAAVALDVFMRVYQNGNGNIVVVGTGGVTVFKLTGTVEAGVRATANYPAFTNGLSSWDIVKLSASSAVLFGTSGSGAWMCGIFTDTAGTPAFGGAALTGNVNGASTTVCALPLQGTTATFIMSAVAVPTASLVLNCSAATPTLISSTSSATVNLTPSPLSGSDVYTNRNIQTLFGTTGSVAYKLSLQNAAAAGPFTAFKYGPQSVQVISDFLPIPAGAYWPGVNQNDIFLIRNLSASSTGIEVQRIEVV